jgi:hypothetical protein
MAKARNTYGEDRYVPWLGRVVKDDEVVTIPDEHLENYAAAGWEIVAEGKGAK